MGELRNITGFTWLNIRRVYTELEGDVFSVLLVDGVIDCRSAGEF